MRNKYMLIVKNYFLLLTVFVFVCALLTMDSKAAYTKSNKAKRVAATYDDVGARFSSNYMDEWISNQANDISRKALYVKKNETAAERTVKISVSNFARGVKGNPYDRSISYTITAWPVYLDSNGIPQDASAADMGSKTITIENTKVFSSASVTPRYSHESTLSRGGENTDNYTITFNAAFVSETKTGDYTGKRIYLRLQATPNGNNYSDLNTLSCLLYFTLDETVEGGYWQGYFNDPGANISNGSATDFDGYNYVIEGVGTGTGKLQWNPLYLSLNTDSLRLLGNPTPSSVTVEGESGWNEVEISLNSNITGRYDIQFYQVYELVDRTVYGTWSGIISKVKFVKPTATTG